MLDARLMPMAAGTSPCQCQTNLQEAFRGETEMESIRTFETGRARKAVTVGVLVVLLSASVAPDALAATPTNAWTARIASGGANGSATLTAYTSGTGSLVLNLTKFAPAASYAVTLAKGSCTGSTVIRLPAIKANASGAANRTTSLTAGQLSAIYAATAGGRRLIIRIGTGSTAKCGLFNARVVAPYLDAAIVVGRSPGGLVIDATGVWVTSVLDDTLARIDPATNTVVQTVPLTLAGGGGPNAIAASGGSLWVATSPAAVSLPQPGWVLRVDPSSGTIIATIPADGGGDSIAIGPDAVWVGNWNGDTVLRIDPITNTVVARVSLEKPGYLAADTAGVWVSSYLGTVSRIDPATNRVVATLDLGYGAGPVALGAGSVWVASPGSHLEGRGKVTRIDSATNRVVATIVVDEQRPLAPSAFGVAVGGGSVWVSGGGNGDPIHSLGSVVQLDPGSNRIVRRIAVPPIGPGRLVANDRAVWGLYGGVWWGIGDSTFPLPGGVIRITHSTGTLAKPAPMMIAPLAMPTPSLSQ